jgi:hypothetical protein
MDWSLIPEVFFDLIARVVPGSLFLVGAFAVHLGPTGFAGVVVEKLPDTNLAFLLLFGLLAYFVAIVLKEVWDLGPAIARRRVGDDRLRSDPFLSIRKRIPAEALRLLKLQAEKNMCEVLVPGLAVLLYCDAWKIAAGPSGDLRERIALATVIIVSGFACWRWRQSLERLYRCGLMTLENLIEEKRADEPGEN